MSVVLVTYNRPEALSHTIESVLAQTFQDFELLICDDASPDSQTAGICTRACSLDRRVRYRRRATNLGMPQNLNLGIMESSGLYIANLHDGDLYRNDLLERWVEALDSFPSAGFVFNAYHGLSEDGRVVNEWRAPLAIFNSGQNMLDLIFSRVRFDSPIWGTVMARREVYHQLGLLNPRFGFFADVDMWMRISETFDVCYVDEPLIALPSRASLPRQFSVGLAEQRWVLWSIHWAAHRRASRPNVHRILRHGLHLGVDAALTAAVALRDLFRTGLPANRVKRVITLLKARI